MKDRINLDDIRKAIERTDKFDCIEEDRLKHLLSLLEIHWENYGLYQKQYDLWTDALVPPIIMSGLMKEEYEVYTISRELQNILFHLDGAQVAIQMEEI